MALLRCTAVPRAVDPKRRFDPPKCRFASTPEGMRPDAVGQGVSAPCAQARGSSDYSWEPSQMCDTASLASAMALTTSSRSSALAAWA